MKFGVSFEVDSDLETAAREVSDFVERLSEELSNFDFGAQVEELGIGLVWIRTVPGYEDWFKERSPRLRKVPGHELGDGGKNETRYAFTYDIKFSDSEIAEISADETKALDYFCTRFVASLKNFERPSIKKRNFEFTKFRKTVTDFIEKELNQSAGATETVARPPRLI